MPGVANVALRAAGWAFVKPSANPISRWELDETSSAQGVFEDRGPAFVSMIVAGIWADMTTGSLVEEVGGTSAYTDGSAYARIPADEPQHNLAALTISFYYQRNSAAARQVLLAAGDGTQAGDFSIEILSNGRLRGYHVGADHVLRFFESPDGITGTDLQVGTAHRIDLTLGLQGARIYLDGSELVAAAITANTNGWNNAQDKYLGRWTDGIISPAVGAFDRVRLWNRQLAADEIAELEPAQTVTLPPPGTGYDVSVASFGPNVVSYWKFENNGIDQRGTQDAAITGSPELNVETIVDFDRLVEGAPADGTCIAWPGSSGAHAQVAHNPAHKTPQGSIVVTFQRDTANQKATLVAADRSGGGTSSGPGGLSIEVEANGAPRCFLRRQTNGTPVVLLGQAGDVALDEAYTVIVKWGTPGLSLALWNEDGVLVRRLTDPLVDGLSGTSPIRFGAWHTDVSHHDGPFGRVVWLDRRISDAEEADLARARTVVFQTTPPIGQFPFVTVSNPFVTHAGVADRPGYSPTDPRSASIIDPMSGIEIVRVGGNAGSTVFIDGTTNSGLVFPRRLRNENSPRMQKVFNADGGLLVIDRLFAQSGDPGNSVRSYLIDVDGTHGAGAPFRILRASTDTGLGDSNVGIWWVWDPDEPLRAYSVTDAGAVFEWWPIGGSGHSEGETNQVRGSVAGYGSFNQGRRHQVQTNWSNSAANLYMTLTCRRNSDSRWGGMRINLRTGALGPFIPTPDLFNQDSDRGAQSTSSSGLYTTFTPNGNRQRVVRADQTDGDNPIIVADTDNVDGDGISHCDFTEINGVE